MQGSFFNRMNKHRLALFFSVALLAANLPAQEDSHSFKAGSLAEIKHVREGKPFILMFWSMDCASCMKELDVLAGVIGKHPGLNIVMISTDDVSDKAPVEAMLNKHGLKRVESWIFADSNTQRLRYEVDPSWFGELPRSYFYDAAHNRLAYSGVLSAEHIDAWLAAIKP